jgi:hypothetical protein
VGYSDRFVWGVWVTQSNESFRRVLELWDSPVIEDEPPKFGWLSNSIELYPETLNLKTNLHLRGAGKRPFVELEPTDHPLATEQRKGISIGRVEEIATILLQRH